MKKAYWCTECNKVYYEDFDYQILRQSPRITYDVATWYECDCGSDATEIDIAIVDAILRLNKLGLKTTYCCEGHFNDGYGYSGYIVFSDKSISIATIAAVYGLPEFWQFDGVSDALGIAPINHQKVWEDEEEFDMFKHLYINSLYRWIDKLEEGLEK